MQKGTINKLLNVAIRVQQKIYLVNTMVKYYVNYMGFSYEDDRLLIFREVENHSRLSITLNMVDEIIFDNENCIVKLKDQ
jgi:hypothetical protein